ncbi:hypothetical protein HY213_00620 [Candidatus Peregrinibacteria bacterium]|nr:hypothetical protein [Candidatus Peregrinibacteria bacterium]
MSNRELTPQQIRAAHAKVLLMTQQLVPRTSDHELQREGIRQRLNSVFLALQEAGADFGALSREVQAVHSLVKMLLQNDMKPASKYLLWEDFYKEGAEGTTSGQCVFSMDESIVSIPPGVHFVKNYPTSIPFGELQLRLDDGILLAIQRKHFPKGGIPVE